MAGAEYPILSVLPTRGLVDEKFKVLVENLSPGLPLTLHSLHHSEDKDYWEAYGHYVSDSRGTVNVSEDTSFGGTYTGEEPMGLLWSMQPVPGSRTGLRLRKVNVQTPMVILISVYRGHVTEGFREKPPPTSVVIERWYMAPGVKRIDVQERGVIGTLFIPPGLGPFPGVLDMWGGGGGLLEYRAALLASHGFAAMALKYLSADKHRAADVDFQYFETAFCIVQEHPSVMHGRVGILGLSLGASVTFTLASCSEVVRPRCCICVSGSHLRQVSDPIDKALVLIDRNKRIRVDENNNSVMRDMYLPIPSNPAMKADVGRIKCPLLLVNGDDDQNTASVEAAEDIAKMMCAAGNYHLLTSLTYPNSGHLIEPPYTPHIRASNFIFPLTREKVIMLWGGQPKPHADAQEDSWEKILAFLKQHLYPSPHTVLQARM